MQHPPVEHTWQLPWKLNTGVWYLVAVEMSQGEMRVRVNSQHILLDLELGTDGETEEGPEDRTTHLYVGGTPRSVQLRRVMHMHIVKPTFYKIKFDIIVDSLFKATPVAKDYR